MHKERRSCDCASCSMREDELSAASFLRFAVEISTYFVFYRNNVQSRKGKCDF